jgi:hypothetical protein
MRGMTLRAPEMGNNLGHDSDPGAMGGTRAEEPGAGRCHGMRDAPRRQPQLSRPCRRPWSITPSPSTRIGHTSCRIRGSACRTAERNRHRLACASRCVRRRLAEVRCAQRCVRDCIAKRYPSARRWPPRPSTSPLVCHPLALDILLASPLPSLPLTDRGFASMSCPRYSFRLFGHSLIRYSLRPHPFGGVSTSIMYREVP